MDRQFLTFWGNFLLQAAEGQKRLEDLNRWMSGGFSGADDLTEMFKAAYGLKAAPPGDSPRAAAWDQAAARFQKALADYMDLFGAVPRHRYEALKAEKERLARKAQEQARTIRQLRLELGKSRAAEGKVFDGFQQLMEVQHEQFRQVSERMNRFFSGAAATAGEKRQKAETSDKS